MTERFLRDLYSVTGACVGCGICAKVCPAGCFAVCNSRAERDPTGCQMCIACIHTCPQDAIRLGLDEPHPGAHYRNSHISPQEIIEADHQV